VDLAWRARLAGFTLVELLVAVAIFGILMSVAAPGVQTFFERAKLSTQSNTLLSAINYGRSEAIKGGDTVSICARKPDDTCAVDGNWGRGWIIFFDSEVSGTKGIIDAGEAVARISKSSGNQVDIKASAIIRPNAMASVSSLSFNARGLADWTVGTFVLCDSRGSNSAHALIVNGAGSVRVAKDVEGTAALDASGTAVTC